MCFYLFSKGKDLAVEYATEDIRILINGQAESNIDLFVKNDGQTEIKYFDILYPSASFFVNNKKPIQIKHINKFFKDITYTILEPDNSNNFKYGFNGQYLSKMNDHHIMSCKLPDHAMPSKPISMTCTVRDVAPDGKSINEVVPCAIAPTLNREKVPLLFALQDMNFSIVRYCMKTPIIPEEKRFFRFSIGPFKRNLHTNNIIKRMFLKFYNALYMPYEIISPYDVLHRFVNKINIYLSANPEEYTRSETRVYVRLKNYVEKHIQPSTTKFKSWKIVVHPDKFRLFHNIVPIGNIKPLGVIPNDNLSLIDDYAAYSSVRSQYPRLSTLLTKLKLNLLPYKIRTYDFITQNEYEQDGRPKGAADIPFYNYDEKYGFRLYFTGKYPTYTYKTMRFLLLFLLAYVVLLKPYSDYIDHTKIASIMPFFTDIIAFVVPLAAFITSVEIINVIILLFHKLIVKKYTVTILDDDN